MVKVSKFLTTSLLFHRYGLFNRASFVVLFSQNTASNHIPDNIFHPGCMQARIEKNNNTDVDTKKHPPPTHRMPTHMTRVVVLVLHCTKMRMRKY